MLSEVVGALTHDDRIGQAIDTADSGICGGVIEDFLKYRLRGLAADIAAECDLGAGQSFLEKIF